MKTLLITGLVYAMHITSSFSQPTTYDVLRLSSNTEQKGILQFGLSSVIIENVFDGGGYALQIKNWNSSSSYTNSFRINANGNIGIGTLTPTSKLEVKGDLKLYDGTSAHKGVIRFGLNDVIIENSPDGANSNDLQFKNWNGTTHTNTLRIKSNGNVGIGATTNIDAKLTVAGDIHSREVKVTINAGADFVFNESYELKTLNEVEKFITKNHHLPDIDPAAHMEENGLELGKMDMKLLQKIEELTLYLIEQNKKIEMLEKRLGEKESKDRRK